MRPIARRALAAQSDERLVRLLREGHEPAFEEMVRRYRGPLVAFATAIVSHNRAEDVVQASLEKAHRALLADSREVALKPWLFTIVRNGALNMIRAEPPADELINATSTVPEPGELAEQHEELERLVDAICALPASQRRALVMRELGGEGHAEIAAQLGTTATAVRGLIFRARTSLRDAVGAVLPLPVIRLLLADGPAAAGAASGAAGGGVGAAVLGGAGAKGGTVIAAAIVALGTGIAVEHANRDNDKPDQRAEEVAVRSSNAGGPGDTGSIAGPVATTAAAPAVASTDAGPDFSGDGSGATKDRGSDSGSSGPSGSGGESGPSDGSGSEGGSDPDGSGADGGEHHETGGSSGPGPGGDQEPGDGSGQGSGHDDSDAGSGGDDGSRGPGGSSGPGGGVPESAFEGSDSSGPGSGGDDGSDFDGDGSETPPPTLVVPSSSDEDGGGPGHG